MQDFEICPVGTKESLLKLEEENKELYDHLKYVVDQSRAVLHGEEPEGDDEDFENWFLGACKTLEKADKD